MDHLLLRLPYLRPNGQSEGIPALYLWPGLADCESQNCWKPANYPFSAAEAASLLADFRKLGIRDLETMRLMLDSADLAAQMDARLELADLGVFAACKSAKAAPDPHLEQAHKILIWLWLMEENLSELSALAESCREAEASLLHGIMEEENPHAKSCPCSAGMGKTAAKKDGIDDMSHLFPWRTCVASAAFFIPPEIPVLAEGQMLADMLEAAIFENAEARTMAGSRVREARAPLWRILGHSRETASHGDVYNTERSWICQ